MYCSFLPHHIKSSIVFSQRLRLKRICSHILDYEHQAKILTQGLLSRAILANWYLNKSTARHKNVRTKSMTSNYNEKTNAKRITYITQFYPSIATFREKLIKTGWTSVQKIVLIIGCPIPSYMPINNHLIYNIYIPIPRTRNQPCHKPQCKVYSHYDTWCGITFDNNVKISAVKCDCDSQNVVYILICAKCLNVVYVGEIVIGFDIAITNTAWNII